MTKILSFTKNHLKFDKKILPPNHPSLATSYNNIAGVYYSIREYSKALAFFQRALNILQSSISFNYPKIKTVQENIDFLK